MLLVVVDTNVLVSALLGGGGKSRHVLLACLRGELQPVIGAALQTEYEDVFSREHLWASSATTALERERVLDAFLSRCSWIEVFFAWRPNLPDEGDNHLVELALAAQAHIIVSKNIRDLRGGELKFPSLNVFTPKQVWEKYLCQP